MLRSLRMLLESLHVEPQPDQREFQRPGDIRLPSPAVDLDLVRVDHADGHHVAQRVDHGLVAEADQEQLEVGAVRPSRPPRLALHNHFADSLGGRLGLLLGHGTAVVGQNTHQLRPRLSCLPYHI